MQDKPARIVSRSQDLDGIVAQLRRTRDLGQEPPVRAAELKLTVGLSLELVAFLVHGAVVAATEQREVRERRGAACRPVTEMMALCERQPASGEAAAAVTMQKRAT